MHNYKLSGNAFEPRATKIYENSNVINVGKNGRIASLVAGAVLYSASAKGNENFLKKALRYGGMYLLYRGISGNCLLTAMVKREEFQMHSRAVNIRSCFIVRAPRQLVYETWRKLEKLPRFLKHIKKIKVQDELHSRWILKTPGRIPAVEWTAEIIDQEEGRELSWRSLPGSKIETAGKINFANTTGGTEMNVTISYRPPGGYIGSAAAAIINPWLKRMVEEDLVRFKRYIEAKAIDYSHTSHDY